MKKPTYILAAAPNEPSNLKGMFELGKGTIMDLLEHPPEKRYAEWGLNTSERSRVGKGRYLEIGNKEEKLIRLYGDGTLIVQALADESYLGWSYKGLQLNPLGLVEFTYNFAEFYAKLLPFFLKMPKSFRFQICFFNAFSGNRKLSLAPGPIGFFSLPIDIRQAPENELRGYLDEISGDNLRQSPGRVTFQLLQQVYHWFGFSSDSQIPYTKSDNESQPIIDYQYILDKYS